MQHVVMCSRNHLTPNPSWGSANTATGANSAESKVLDRGSSQSPPCTGASAASGVTRGSSSLRPLLLQQTGTQHSEASKAINKDILLYHESTRFFCCSPLAEPEVNNQKKHNSGVIKKEHRQFSLIENVFMFLCHLQWIIALFGGQHD